MKAAIVQYPPVFLDLERTLEHAVRHIEEAAGLGAELIVFPEAWFPGYPIWVQRARPEGDLDMVVALVSRLQDNAVDLASDDLAPVRAAAREHGVVVVAAHQEIDRAHSGTIFNSVAIIDADGTILNNHRKVMPTLGERMVWGFGDASTIRVVETAVGRVGALLCWENLMPLARYALYAQMPEIYVAPTADVGEGWQASMQHIARESCAYVLAGSTSWRLGDLPDDVPFRDRLVDDEEAWISPGEAVVYEPFGPAIAGPMRRERGLLVAELDLEKCRLPRSWFDVTGHYARPDLFRLEVDTAPQSPVRFSAG